MRKEKSRDAARSRRSKENHEFYELAKLLPLPAAITSQLDFLDKASIIRLTISFLKLRQFSVNGHPPWAPDFTTLGSVNPYSAAQAAQAAAAAAAAATSSTTTTDHQATSYQVNSSPDDGTNEHNNGRQNQLTPSSVAFHAPQAPPLGTTTTRQVDFYLHQHQPMAVSNDPNQMIEKNNFNKANTAASLFDIHQGTHILQSLDGFAFAIGRDGRFLYISETVSMYLGLSQVEMTGSSVFDYTHQQDHEELAQQLGISYSSNSSATFDDSSCQNQTALAFRNQDDEISTQAPESVQSQYSAASSETLIEDHLGEPRNGNASPTKRVKIKKCSPALKSKQQKLSSSLNAASHLIKLESSDEIEPVNKQSSNGNKNNSFKLTPNNTNSNDLSFLSSLKDKSTSEDLLVRQFCIRMKSTLTKRGCQHFKSSGYRVVHVVAHLRSYQSNDHGHLMDPLDDPKQQQRPSTDANQTTTPTGDSTTATASSTTSAKQTTANKQVKRRGPRGVQSKTVEVAGEDSTPAEATGDEIGDETAGAKANSTGGQAESQGLKVSRRSRKIIGMVAVAIALPPPSINELRLESDTFVLRLNLDLKITHVEPKITELLHHPMELLTGQSLYSFVHPADLEQVVNCHRDLLKKGQMMSGYYRLLSRTGGYIWIQTCATLICNSTLNASLLNSSTSQAIGSPVMSMANSQQQQAQLLGGSLSDNTNYRQQQAPTPSGSSSFLSSPINHQQIGGAKLVASSSPSVSGSFTSEPAAPPSLNQHLDLQPQQLAQDQCIIFVNYMITNVVERREILDICQSKDFMPLMPITNSQEHRNETGNNNNNNETFNSSSSTRSSPCLTSFKSVTSFLPSGNNTQTPGPQTTNSTNIINLSSNSSLRSSSTRHQTPNTTGRVCSSQSTSSTKAARRQSAKVARQQQQSQHQTYLNLGSGSLENGYGSAASPLASCSLNYASPYEGVFQQQQQQHQASYLSHSTDGVNPAVLKHHNHHQDHHHQHQQQQQANHDSSAWLTSHASQQHHQAAADHTSSHYGQTGNGTNSATYSNHHHHQHPSNQHQSQQQQQQQQSAVSNEHYQWNLNGTSIYKAATFAAANLAASSYSSVAAQQAAVAAAAYHQQHPAAAVGAYQHHQHHPVAATAAAVAAAAHHHHHNHHHHAVAHHAIGLGHSSWESVASGAISATPDVSATPASSSLMAAVANPYVHHHQHHPHPPWL